MGASTSVDTMIEDEPSVLFDSLFNRLGVTWPHKADRRLVAQYVEASR